MNTTKYTASKCGPQKPVEQQCDITGNIIKENPLLRITAKFFATNDSDSAIFSQCLCNISVQEAQRLALEINEAMADVSGECLVSGHSQNGGWRYELAWGHIIGCSFEPFVNPTILGTVSPEFVEKIDARMLLRRAFAHHPEFDALAGRTLQPEKMASMVLPADPKPLPVAGLTKSQPQLTH